VAARLLHAWQSDVAVIDPEVHCYQPPWTLAGGSAQAGESARAQAAVLPSGATWTKEAATGIDPDRQQVGLASGNQVGYEFLVVCPGIALD
jgi:sulfide:quinone oxidoreductase